METQSSCLGRNLMRLRNEGFSKPASRARSQRRLYILCSLVAVPLRGFLLRRSRAADQTGAGAGAGSTAFQPNLVQPGGTGTQPAPKALDSEASSWGVGTVGAVCTRTPSSEAGVSPLLQVHFCEETFWLGVDYVAGPLTPQAADRVRRSREQSWREVHPEWSWTPSGLPGLPPPSPSQHPG